MVEVLSRYKFLDHILEDNKKKSQSVNIRIPKSDQFSCSKEEITLDLE